MYTVLVMSKASGEILYEHRFHDYYLAYRYALDHVRLVRDSYYEIYED